MTSSIVDVKFSTGHFKIIFLRRTHRLIYIKLFPYQKQLALYMGNNLSVQYAISIYRVILNPPLLLGR